MRRSKNVCAQLFSTTSTITDILSKRLLALAAQKFVADIAQDAYQYSKIRAAGSTTGGAALPAQPRGRYGKDRGRAVLTMDDLGKRYLPTICNI